MEALVDSLPAAEQLGSNGQIGIDDDQTEELHTVFDIFDEDRDGKISSEELSRSMAKLGFNLTDAEVVSMMAAVDENGNGSVDFEEFLSLYKPISSAEGRSKFAVEPDEDLMEAFRVFDKNADGFITAQELQSIFSNLGFAEGINLADCHNMIRGVDSDGDGQVSFMEFKTMMNKRMAGRENPTFEQAQSKKLL
ncbi:hypothetical protein O6H91_22G034500 [Diphasiastrum complanatum]|uniref:Uncharacterized protein n=1 Tax=Diphasiastrum complanatum TaxID=34168 RepID=A0ACC2AEP8_DIPCM|nr:hypothetical protein O6H91_22G034500 [Diphasiastrum complanatum]